MQIEPRRHGDTEALSSAKRASVPPRLRGKSLFSENWVGTHIALILICAGFFIPFAWMVSTSLKSNTEAMVFPPKLIPSPANWETYETVWHHPRFDFPLYARNTLVIAALAVTGTTLASSIVAYGFAKIRFRGRGVLFGLMLSTMMIPFPVTMVSLFALYRWLDVHTPIQFLGTNKPLWLPACFGTAFNIFLLRQFFMTIPDELSEAARLDGCSDFGIFWRIVLPLSKPALSCVALFTFMGVWNDFLGPSVYLQHPDQYTLALGLQQLQGFRGAVTEWNVLMGAATLVIAPLIVLFFLTQRTFIQGIATTGIK